MRRDLPQEWRAVMEPKGLHSGRDLARAIAVAPQTANRLIYGGYSSRETMLAAAEALGVTVERIHKLRKEPPVEPFVLPAEADHLTPSQREAVRVVIKAMLETAEQPKRRGKGYAGPRTAQDRAAKG